jgi:hypothetical protein
VAETGILMLVHQRVYPRSGEGRSYMKSIRVPIVPRAGDEFRLTADWSGEKVEAAVFGPDGDIEIRLEGVENAGAGALDEYDSLVRDHGWERA